MKNNKEAFRIFCYILLEVFAVIFSYFGVCFFQNNYYLNYKKNAHVQFLKLKYVSYFKAFLLSVWMNDN